MATAQEDRIVSMVTANAPALLRLARRVSLCEDDAADAYQRTLELYLGRMHRLDEATVAGWLRTVCKHEALRIRASRSRVISTDPAEWDEHPSVDVGDAMDRVESLERVARAAEALSACEPEEARAMLLRAGGATYRQISQQCGWTESRVSRSLASGRARFLERFSAIESGEVCEAFAPMLSLIVDGEATPDDFLVVRPHLRHCAGCRASLKALYDAEPALGALLPAGALVVGGPGLVSRWVGVPVASFGERVVRAHAVIETASSTKAAAVGASAATVAAGGAVAVDHAARRPAAVARVAGPQAAAAATPTATGTPVPTATAGPTATADPTASPSTALRATATPRSEAFASATPAPVAETFSGSGIEGADTGRGQEHFTAPTPPSARAASTSRPTRDFASP